MSNRTARSAPSSSIDRDDFPSGRDDGMDNDAREDVDVVRSTACDKGGTAEMEITEASNSSIITRNNDNNIDASLAKHHRHHHRQHHRHQSNHGSTSIVIPSAQALSTLIARSLSMSSSSCSCSPVSGITSSFPGGASLFEDYDRETSMMNDSTISCLDDGSPNSDYPLLHGAQKHRPQHQEDDECHSPKSHSLQNECNNNDNSLISNEVDPTSHLASQVAKANSAIVHRPLRSTSVSTLSPAHSCPSDVEFVSQFQSLTIQCHTPVQFSGQKREDDDAHDNENVTRKRCNELDLGTSYGGIYDMLTIRHSNTKDEDENDDKYVSKEYTGENHWWDERTNNDKEECESKKKCSTQQTIENFTGDSEHEEDFFTDKDQSFQLSLSDHDHYDDEYEFADNEKRVSSAASSKNDDSSENHATEEKHLETHVPDSPLDKDKSVGHGKAKDLQDANPNEKKSYEKDINDEENDITFGHCVNLDLDMEGAIEIEVLSTTTRSIDGKQTKDTNLLTPKSTSLVGRGYKSTRQDHEQSVPATGVNKENKDSNDLIFSPSWSSQPTNSSSNNNTPIWNDRLMSEPIYFKRSLTLPELGSSTNRYGITSNADDNNADNDHDEDDEADGIYYNLSSWSISNGATSTTNEEDDDSIDRKQSPKDRDKAVATIESASTNKLKQPSSTLKRPETSLAVDGENTTNLPTLQEMRDTSTMIQVDSSQTKLGYSPKLFVFDDSVKGTKGFLQQGDTDQKWKQAKVSNPPSKLVHITSSTDESSAARISSKTSSNCSAQTSSPFSFLRGQEISVDEQEGDQSILQKHSNATIDVVDSSDRDECGSGIPKSALLSSSSSSSDKIGFGYNESKGDKSFSTNETVSYKWEFHGVPITAASPSFRESRIALNHTLGCLMMVKRYNLRSATEQDNTRYDDTKRDHLQSDGAGNEPRSPRKKLLQELRREIEIMRSLKHENIVKFLGSSVTTSAEVGTMKEESENQAKEEDVPFFVFQELMPSSTLTLTNLVKKFGPLSTFTMRSYLSQLLRGLSFLHQHHIVHCDLKGDNILICPCGTIKISDFGLARHLLSHEQGHPSFLSITHQSLIDADASTSPVSCISSSSSIDFEARKDSDANNNSNKADCSLCLGKEEISSSSASSDSIPFFVAPEVFTGQFGRKCDIWSVGCIVYQMITGSPPWENLNFHGTFTLFLHLKRTTGCPPPFVATEEGRVTTALNSTAHGHDPRNISNNPSNHHPNIQCHSELRTLMEFCFQRNPRERPSARRLLRTDFLSKIRHQKIENHQPPNDKVAKKKQQDLLVLTHQQLRSSHQPYASTPIKLSALPRVSSLVSSAKEKASLFGLSPKIFTDSGSVGHGLAKHELRDHSNAGSKPITPRSAPRLTHTSATASNVRRLPPTSAKKETAKRILVLGTPLKQSKESGTARNIPPSGRKLRSTGGGASLASYHGFDNTNNLAFGAATLSDDMSCSKDSTATFGNKSATHQSLNNTPGQQNHETNKAFVMFDLTYSNSNESEDLPISIHPLDSDVTSPLSNCSSTGENSSVGHCSIASQVLSDHWPSWAKQRKEEIDKTKQKGRAFVANAASSLNNMRQQNPFEKKSTAGANNEVISSKGNIPRPAPRAPTTEPRKKKMNPFARKAH